MSEGNKILLVLSPRRLWERKRVKPVKHSADLLEHRGGFKGWGGKAQSSWALACFPHGSLGRAVCARWLSSQMRADSTAVVAATACSIQMCKSDSVFLVHHNLCGQRTELEVWLCLRRPRKCASPISCFWERNWRAPPTADTLFATDSLPSPHVHRLLPVKDWAWKGVLRQAYFCEMPGTANRQLQLKDSPWAWPRHS